MRPSVRLVLVALLAFALGSAAPAAAAPDVTPLESSPGLSSGFGEFRDAHFHAGLDYSTDEQEGRPVRAVNDGWVERVRASGVGYGRAVYLRLDDGRTVVYGHLSRFAPRLDAFVGAHQESAGVYEQDLEPLPNLIRFARGEIVAWSGQSGAGPPHLHFEVRRGDENFNPLLHGFAMLDHVAPTLATAWLTPHGPHARVGGGIDEVRVALRPGASVTAPPVVGEFDLAVDTWDRADGKPNKLATYRLEARVDGDRTPAFEAVVDSFSWDTTVEVERVYDYAATLRGDETRRTLAKLPTYKEAVVRRGPAMWSLPPGTHRIELTAVDEAGNRAVATLVVPVGMNVGTVARGSTSHRVLHDTLTSSGIGLRGSTLYIARGAGSPVGHAGSIEGARLADSVTTARPPIEVYVVSPEAGERWTTSFDPIVDLGVPESSAAPRAVGHMESGVSPSADGLLLLGDRPDSMVVKFPLLERAIRMHQPVFTFTIAPHTFFDSVAVWFALAPKPADAGELIAVAGGLEFAPQSLVLRAACRVVAGIRDVSNAIPAGRTGLFLRRTGGWSLVAERGNSGAYVGSTRRLGTFAVFADTTAPRIVAAPETRWRHPAAAADSSRAPRLSFIITDRGAGLAPADQSIYVDGRRVPAEYDPEASRLNWYPRAWPAAGRHDVRIEAVDRLGNRSVRVVALAVD
jgi:hypothetical protein